MTKPPIRELRFDFRGGRNTAVSADLLSSNELVDATNARLVGTYGAFQKRSGTQRIHGSAFPAPVLGVFQWDTSSGKQTVVVSDGKLYYRDGLDFGPGFTAATTSAAARTTANQGSSAGWTDPATGGDDTVNDGKNRLSGVTTSATMSAANRLVLKIGDPTADTNANATDDIYTFKVKLIADGTSLTGEPASAIASVQFEVSLTGGGAYSNVGSPISVVAGPGDTTTQEFTVVLSWSGATAWFRPVLTVTRAGVGAGGTAAGSVQCFNTTYLTDNYAATWSTGAALLSTTQPSVFAPFRKSVAGSPLKLYIASGGHYFEWDGDSKTLSQLDPTNAAPNATAIISYHTRMFAMMASTSTPGLLPKTIAWSKIGDPTNFTITGLKSDGNAAVTDFLTGQQLTALEVIGSSLLMATADSIMRFQGHSSDDIVISQDTEGVSAAVGVVGLLALRRFENVAAFLDRRGPYVATETSAVPIGEKVLPDFDALDSNAIGDSIVIYNQGRKELLFIVPGAADGGLNKTIYVYAPRLQAWYGPWTYSFGITSACYYVGSSGIENVLVGCADGFVRLLDSGVKDDILSDGTGGSNITMTVEMYVNSWRTGRVAAVPGTTRALQEMALEALLPAGSALQIKIAFDGAAFSTFNVPSEGSTERNYRVSLNGQGKRLRLQFVDASAVSPVINGFVLKGWEYGRP